MNWIRGVWEKIKSLFTSKKTDPIPPTIVIPAVKSEHLDLYQKAEIRKEHLGLVASMTGRILSFKSEYDKVEKGSGVPWYVVGCIHSLEGSLNFSTHLHNGDPLTARTKQVPAGRPKQGSPPFAWYTSAIDALSLKQPPAKWDLEGCLWYLEGYNGWGYKKYHPDVPSPYLWSMTTLYSKGKYASDGKFDPELVSKQVGAVCIFKLLERRGLIQFA